MGKPTSLLRGAYSFSRDFARDRMPEGYMWDMVDYVPAMVDSPLTGRGGWEWGSAVAAQDMDTGIYAPFAAGDKLLVIGAGNHLYDVNLTTQAVANVGTAPVGAQNPVMHRDRVIAPQKVGAHTPYVITNAAGTITSVPLAGANTPSAIYAAVYKDRVLLANAPGNSQRLWLSPPGDPTAAWDVLTYFNSSHKITGIAALRAVILLFHEGSVERIRGAIPPSASDPLGDMFMESLFDRAGCGDAKSIAYWQDNCIFADSRGVHFTDGAVVRNLASQGNILSYWRTLYRQKKTIAAATFLDYYIVTVIRTDGVAVTLVCDLTRRTWFRFNNIRAISYIHSVGLQEQLWACREATKRLTALSNCFFPILGTDRGQVAVISDADGTAVLPQLETPWYRFAAEGRKRIRFAYASYDARYVPFASGGPSALSAMPGGWRGAMDGEGQILEPEVAAQADLANQDAISALAEVKALELAYITLPQDTSYTVAGRFPATTSYARYRLPIGQNPYGMAFRIRQLAPSYVTRLYDFAVDASADERSRV